MSARSAFDPDAEAVALRALEALADGAFSDFEALTHAEFVNHEANDEPPACRGRGPAAAHATALWLRAAFADLRWEVLEVIAERDLVAVHVTMSGRHTGDFVTYGEEGGVAEAFPPTGESFAVTQTHWMRVADGKVIEHWANRDDLAIARQCGWVPPTARYLVRMAVAKARARRR
jgi:predicted ester cyclase